MATKAMMVGLRACKCAWITCWLDEDESRLCAIAVELCRLNIVFVLYNRSISAMSVSLRHCCYTCLVTSIF